MKKKPTNAPMLGTGVTGREPELSNLRIQADQDVSLVLVSDDAPAMIDLVHLIVRPRLPTCVVVGNTTGHRTLALAQRLLPDLITTDGSKWDMSGEELIRRLKAEPDLQSIPVMVVSASWGRARSRMVQTNVHSVVPKPYSPAELLRAFLSVLSDAQHPRTLEDLRERKREARSHVTVPLFVGLGWRAFEDHYDVRTAVYEAERAIRVARRLLPDVIVLKERLGDVSGLTVLARLKRDPYVRDTPVLMISGEQDHEFRQQSLDAGAHSVHTMEDFTHDFQYIIRNAIGIG